MTWVVAGRRMMVGRETLLLLAICFADAVSSAILFHFQVAVEANPLLRPFAEAGALPLISVKMLWSIVALGLLELYAQRKPEFVRPLVRRAIYLYLGIYGLSVGSQFIG